MGGAEGRAGRPRSSAVALVGFMAVGKSVVGGLLAERLSLPFVDTDALVERREGPIPAIFEERGEDGFRRVEREVTLEALARVQKIPAVIALGGGAVLSDQVRAALRRLRHVIWLTAPIEVLWRRTRAVGATGRPLAGDEALFHSLYERRASLYREVATAEVRSDGSRPEAAIADEIAALALAGFRPRVGAGEAERR